MRAVTLGLNRLCSSSARFLNLGRSNECQLAIISLYSGIRRRTASESQGLVPTQSFQDSLFKNQIMQTRDKEVLLTNKSILHQIQKIGITQRKPSPVQEPKDLDINLELDSVLRKRRKKMKKHKLRKRRKRERAMKRKLSQGRSSK